ncbi:MAG: DUF4012 domain-containing protein, partial [Actinomycetota bacterium]|nr:DUF4012 domain-containing protein [Actinomycetota bacterium]
TATGGAAARLAPAMLGGDGRRTYFVAFTTPAESRGLGGFMGTWAEVRADGGRLDVVRTGQTGELIRGYRPTELTGPDDYLARYGRFGAGVDGEPAAVDFWSNYTISPDLPSVAEIARQLYPASGGREIDGVIAVDVFGISRFLELTGPINVPEIDGRVDAGNAVEYLLRGQYAEIADDNVRDDVLERITESLLDQVFNETLPGPRVLADTLGPSLADGHISVWSFDRDDQVLLAELGISGAMPEPAPDGLAVTSTNAAANKLDAYLRRSITYEGVYDDESGRLRTTATIRLTNAAPARGLPADVASNRTGRPQGTNRMYLSVYSPWSVTAARLDGEPVGLEPDRELGWRVYSRYVEIAPGDEAVLELEFSGELPEGTGYGLALHSPPLALPDVVRLDVRDGDGDELIASHGPRVGTDVVRPG